MVQDRHDALSHIDIRVEKLFDNQRQKYYGEISKQNLGPGYGCYGTFLPTELILPQASSAAIENHSNNLGQYHKVMHPNGHTNSALPIKNGTASTLKNSQNALDTRMPNDLPDPDQNLVNLVKSRPQSSSIKADTNRLQQMSAPCLASSVRRNIIRIRIKKSQKEASAVIIRKKEELYNNSSSDMKPPESNCCSSSQVSKVAQPGSPSKILELMTVDPLSGRPIHSPLKSRISNLVPLSSQMGKLPPTKRPSEGILDLDRGQKRRKLIDDSLREKGMVLDGRITVIQGTLSQSVSGSSGSHQILTSTGSSCVIEGRKKGKICDSIVVPEANESEEASLLLNEARDFKHRADRLKREGEKVLNVILYLEAILKFLRVASLWEKGPGENNEAVVRLYSDTAKLCHYCAAECQMEQNMPAAALAYKAMELAYMRSAFVKSTFPKEAVSMGGDMIFAFEATQRYQIILTDCEELAVPMIACLNFHFNDVALFIRMAHRALETIF